MKDGKSSWNSAQGKGKDTQSQKASMDSWKTSKARKNPMAEQTIKGTRQPKACNGWC